MIMSQGAPKGCDSCKSKSLLAFYTCRTCPPQSDPHSFDLCLSCCNNLAREAHQECRGPAHEFVFARRDRYCDGCKSTISSDFMMCNGCPQDLYCFDLCLTCALSRQPAHNHVMSTNQNHSFRYIEWLPTSLPSEMKSAQPFKLNWRWNCDGHGPRCARTMDTPFFHCLSCAGNGYDMCASCADNGGIFRHCSTNGHRFSFIAQLKPDPIIPSRGRGAVHHDEPPPPYRDW